MNTRLREKRDLIISMLLYGLLLLAQQLFRHLVLLLFLVLDSPFFCCLVLDPPLVCRLIMYPLRFLDLQLFYRPFLCSVQLLLILHLQLSDHSNKLCQMSLCAAVQPALYSLFICFRLLAHWLPKPTTSRILIQHLSTLAYLSAIILEMRLT